MLRSRNTPKTMMRDPKMVRKEKEPLKVEIF
jgi:hypothetical protein